MYSANDFQPIHGVGAIKLAASGIGPLVALAQGIATLTPDTVRPFLKTVGIFSNTHTKKIVAAVGDTDALYMPWYRPAGGELKPGSDPSPCPQFRPDPANIIPDPKTGRASKYLMLYGQPPIIGAHPATPASWLSAPRAILAEGMLKGLAALTAQLAAAGVDLTIPDTVRAADDPVLSARAVLRAAMEQVPAPWMIYSSASTTTWENHSEWTAIPLKDSRWLIGFDADVRTNPKVWKQADKLVRFLESRRANPLMIMLPDDTDNKTGLDDWLAGPGDWDSLLALAGPLPPQPEGGSPHAGLIRMNPKTLVTEKFVQPNEDAPGWWQTLSPFVARVRTIEDHRDVSPSETETGDLDVTLVSDDGALVNVGVAWTDDGQPCEYPIRGTIDLLTEPPSQWRRTPRYTIHPQIARLKDWPPIEREFTAAMKAFRVDDIEMRPAWTHMGWVPTGQAADGDSPVFVVGEQAVGPAGDTSGKVALGVDESEVSGATKFGVILPDDLNDARQAFRATFDAYYPACPDESAWQDRRDVAILMAAALRPCVPLQARLACMLAGSSSAGKSWSAAYGCFVFWQAKGGTWTNRTLPGSGSDTAASIEVAVSKTPIWAVDDIAPSSVDPQKAKQQQASALGTIRNVFNDNSRARRTSTMEAARKFRPRAVYIVTAEQLPDVDPSILNRLVVINVRKGKFLSVGQQPLTRIEQLGEAGVQAKVTGFALQMLARRIHQNGWGFVTGKWRDLQAQAKTDALAAIRQVVGDDTAAVRHAETASDLMLGVILWRKLAAALGVEDEYRERLDEMAAYIHLAAVSGTQQSAALSLGARFIDDLKAALASGRAYVSDWAQDAPPFSMSDRDDADALNADMGWPAGGAQPHGARIGWLIRGRDGTEYVLFNQKAAWTMVSRGFDGWGSRACGEVWQSVIDNGLYAPDWGFKAGSSGSTRTQRIMQAGVARTGLAIPLTELLEDTGPDTNMPVPQAA